MQVTRRQRALRPTPRPFEFPWGKGEIVEEVAFRGQHHEPTIQLLAFESGMSIIRFCSYTLSGRFERNSWLVGKEELAGLRAELGRAPRIRRFLSDLLEAPKTAVRNVDENVMSNLPSAYTELA